MNKHTEQRKRRGVSRTPPSFRSFETWLLDQGYTPRTAEQYRQRCEKFHRRIGNLQNATTKALLVAERENKRVAPSTRNGNRQALMAWYRYCGRPSGGPAARMSHVTPPAGLPRPLDSQQRELYVASAEALSPRHLLVALMGVAGGLRLHEVAGAKWTNLYSDELLVKGKGGHERLVPLTQETLTAWHAWRAVAPTSEWVFARLKPRDGCPERVTEAQVRRLHFETCDAAGLPRVNYHRLRHTAATEWYAQSGGDILATGLFLGHRSPVSTRVYAAVRSARLREIADRMYR